MRKYILIPLSVLALLCTDTFAWRTINGFIVKAPGSNASIEIEHFKEDYGDQMKEITFKSRGKSHTAHAVPLLVILRGAGIETDLQMDSKADPKAKNRALRISVTVTGRDGYAADFSLGEMLPDIGNRAVWVAIDRDGDPLSLEDGPMELIVPDDAKPARWIRGINYVIVKDDTAPTTQP